MGTPTSSAAAAAESHRAFALDPYPTGYRRLADREAKRESLVVRVSDSETEAADGFFDVDFEEAEILANELSTGRICSHA
jgi:hypothetical protein